MVSQALLLCHPFRKEDAMVFHALLSTSQLPLLSGREWLLETLRQEKHSGAVVSLSIPIVSNKEEKVYA